jgi:diaminohydroxyphosphoribosylaminopyrimidine deaminase/5-amino-6-(5-phosphoribosylamino)uracil reductase
MDHMEYALSLARIALGQTSPNPAVGAVIIQGGQKVGEGYTQPVGGDHAEVVALKQAGSLATGATMYVTLEPCFHQGRTPPCTGFIIDSGINEIHIATLDDNPLTNGKGKTQLEAAGINVITGQHEIEARQLNEAYFRFIRTGIPFITAKYAMSLDGKIATKSGDSKWISSEESRDFAHGIRFVSDAIMVGINTVIKDDPHLTARSGHGRGGVAHRQPLRVIVDESGRTPLKSKILHEQGQTLIALGKWTPRKEEYSNTGAEVVEFPSDDGRVDLSGLIAYLGSRDITSVLVEGGSQLLGSLFDMGLIDKVIAFMAPIIIGGDKAITPVGGLGVDRVVEAFRLHKIDVKQLGSDIIITGYVAKD